MSSLTTQDPIHLVQITDTHLYGKPTGTLLKMNTHDSLARVVDLVKEKEQHIDYILATGDIAQDASLQAYQHFIGSMAELQAPCSWIPGNHDRVAVMEELGAKASFNDKLVTLNNWRIIFLDSSVDGQVHGKLTDAELKFLQDSLSAADSDESISHCLVCLHHNPTKGNSGWMKDIGLHNGKEFFDIAVNSSKLRAVLYGHVHQELDYQHRGVRCLCTPSTCIQFKPFVTNFSLDKLNPGYRALRLHESGQIDTEVHRIEGYTIEADFSSTGY
jgi:Icc protein